MRKCPPESASRYLHLQNGTMHGVALAFGIRSFHVEIYVCHTRKMAGSWREKLMVLNANLG